LFLFEVDSRVNLAEACFSFDPILLLSHSLFSRGAEFFFLFFTWFFTPDAPTAQQDPVILLLLLGGDPAARGRPRCCSVFSCPWASIPV
jgi:hypothetical protein